ncbi:MAG: hypothetical protein MnENMB40S_33550 [Rhizobiaceae bacterium MnEN-MB40S]|nr:MAG: hypothetical protein MnENMB40S_33550 [Rhizobiaceae bacterium MnEN-MB40S]
MTAIALPGDKTLYKIDAKTAEVKASMEVEGVGKLLGIDLPTERSGVLEVEGLPSPAADQLYEITFEPDGESSDRPDPWKGFRKNAGALGHILINRVPFEWEF